MNILTRQLGDLAFRYSTSKLFEGLKPIMNNSETDKIHLIGI